MTAELKTRVLAQVGAGTTRVFTDPLASPTGFPFKVVQLPGTLSDPDIYAGRARICNLGYLRQAYRRDDGSIGWRCPAEPEGRFLAKGGAPVALVGRMCLCNALLASAGFAQAAPDGRREPPLVTAGDCLDQLSQAVPRLGPYSAAELRLRP